MDEASKSGRKARMPGMFYMLLSFVPWIVYWVVSGTGSSLGIPAALAISLVLLVPQLRAREFNLMDFFSRLYFLVALLGTFVAGSDIFVDRSGLLGYSVLGVMALTSLAIKQPFTLQCSRRDYPEQYWKDPTFIGVNRTISWVWVGVFLINALIFFFLAGPFTQVAPLVLVVLGIVFSVLFPLKAPARAATARARQYDWQIDIDPGKAKQEDEYDVAVVGAGIGGLSCAALLAVRGYKVLVLEQGSQVGGYCRSFQREGFVFNAGLEDISGLWKNGPLTYLLKELGLVGEDLFVRNNTRYIYKGNTIDVPDSPAEFAALLSKMFPGEKGNIAGFFDEAGRAYEETYMNAPLYGTPLPDYLIAKLLGDRALLNFPSEYPHSYDWMGKTYRQKLDERFGNEDLKGLLCALLGYVGTTPEKTSGLAGLTACLSYYLHGGYFPRGGAGSFASSLKKVIERYGGRVLVNYKADRILTEGRWVRGVRCGGEIFQSRVVVANANARTALLQMVDPYDLGRYYIDYIKGLKMSPSCFLVFLGVDMDLSGYPVLIRDIDGDFGVCINSNADAELAPAGRASVTLIAPVAYHDFPSREESTYSQRKERLAALLVRKAEDLIPELSQHVVVLDAATPRTLERYTLMPEGAIYAFDQSVGSSRPHFKTPVKGLYLAGASTFPGAGIEAVVISGMICANDICGWKFRAS